MLELQSPAMDRPHGSLREPFLEIGGFAAAAGQRWFGASYSLHEIALLHSADSFSENLHVHVAGERSPLAVTEERLNAV